MQIPHQPVCDVFIKVGGSILDHAGHTTALAAGLADLDMSSRPIVLTGGGRVAKRIKANQRGASCELFPSWRAATLALDVNAGLLASHSPHFELTNCVAQMVAALDSGKVPIFAPATALFGSLWFQPNWTVTTDTMGLYFAHLLGAKRYVIVTDVDGVFEIEPRPDINARLMTRISVGELEKLSSSKLDTAFPAYFRRHPIPTTIVNGKHPGRVCDAVCGRRVVGTQVMTELEPVMNGHGLDRVAAMPSVAMAAHSS